MIKHIVLFGARFRGENNVACNKAKIEFNEDGSGIFSIQKLIFGKISFYDLKLDSSEMQKLVDFFNRNFSKGGHS